MSGERITRFETDQQISEQDLNNIGLFSRASLDHVVRDGIDPGKKFVGFNVVQNGAAQVTVGEGWFYNAGRVYHRGAQGGTDVDLIALLPATVRKIVTLVAWGQEVNSALEPRTFLVDVDTEQTEARTVPTQVVRLANLDTVSGLESPDPVPPALSSDVIAVAHVVLSPSGIEEIRPVPENRLPSVADNRNRIGALELFRRTAGAAIDTLRTDLAGVAMNQIGMARRTDLYDVAADVARLKEEAGLPADYAAYGSDNFLDVTGSDLAHPDWLARIEEGVRFSAAQERQANVSLLNQFDDRVKVTSDLMLPAWEPASRLTVDGAVGEIAISSYIFNTWITVQKARTRTRTRFGNTFLMCTNAQAWRGGYIDAATGLFRRGNETFEVLNNIGHPSGNANLLYLRLRQVWTDTYEESYWDRVQIEESVNGAGVAQTFLHSQDGWLTDVGLKFTRIADTGDVRVLITETVNGAPAWDKVIAKTTLARADLQPAPNWTRAPVGPVHLPAGRYSIVVITAGNHFLGTVSENKYAEGSLFVSTDGAFSQGDLTRDLAMDLRFAHFRSPRTEVQMQPLELANGIANIDLLLEAIQPAGTQVIHEIQVNSVWHPLDESSRNVLNGLPALVPYRIVFLGTTDLQAGVAVGAASTATTWRPRTDFQHISETITLPALCNEIELRVTLEWWEAARHTFAAELLTGAGFATTIAPTLTETRELPDMHGVSGRRELRIVFSGLTPTIDTFKIRMDGTTDNALVTYHVARRVYLGFAA